MKRPLVWIAFFFSLGIFAANNYAISFWWAYLCLFVALAGYFLCIRRKLSFIIFLCCVNFFSGVAVFKNSQYLAACHIKRLLIHQKSKLYTLKGIVQSQGVPRGKQLSFLFTAEEIRSEDLGQNCCGEVLVNLRGKDSFRYGEELVLRGNLYRPYLNRQYASVLMSVKSPSSVIKLKGSRGNPAKRLALWLKNQIEQIILRYLPQPSAGILEAMVLGEKRDISPLVYDAMIKSGTVHILVVSGSNVGIVAFAVMLILKMLRLPKKPRSCIAMLTLILYCLTTGASTPVVRATLMGIIFLSAYTFKREPDICNSCCLALLSILVISPNQLFDIGFELSFTSVVAIVFLYPKLKLLFRVGDLKIKFLSFLAEGCLVSLSAWLGTLGLILYHFRIFAPVTVVANIVIVPLAALITLCGFSLVIAALISPALACAIAYTIQAMVTILLQSNALLISLPGACLYL